MAIATQQPTSSGVTAPTVTTAPSETRNPATIISTASRWTRRGDGIADIVYSDGSRWDILPGSPNGGFESKIHGNALNTNKGYTKTIDYNGDGKRDLVVGTPGGNWRVLQSTGSDFTDIDTGVATNNVEDYYSVADYDGDGLEDLVFLGLGNAVWGHRNTGGGFAAAAEISQLEPDESFGVLGGIATSGVKAGGAPDFDGDLKADFLYRYTKTTTPNCMGEPGCFEIPYDTNYWGVKISGSGASGAIVEADDFGDPLLGDFNGDGLTDIAFRKITPAAWHIFFGNGFGFSVTITTVGLGAGAFPFDYDADGMTDLMYSTGSTWYVIRSDGNTFETQVNTGITSGADDTVFRIADNNGDGLTDLIYVDTGPKRWKTMQRSGTRRDLVSKITDGLGNYAEPTYAVPTDSNVYAAGTGAAFPNFDYIGPKTLVKRYKSNNGIGGINTVNYFYKGWKVNVHGLGALGFSEVRESLPNSLVAARYFNQSPPNDRHGHALNARGARGWQRQDGNS